MKHALPICIVSVLLCGCSAAKTTALVASEFVLAPVSLLNPNLYQYDPEAYQKAEKAPPEEWKVLTVGKWKQDKYDKEKNRECRRVEKQHIPTGVIEIGWECRPLEEQKNR